MILNVFVIFIILAFSFSVLGLFYRNLLLLAISMALFAITLPPIYEGIDIPSGKNITEFVNSTTNETITTEQIIYEKTNVFGNYQKYAGLMFFAMIMLNLAVIIDILIRGA